MSFTFVPLGVGDAFSARHYTFCIALEAEGRWWLVDCPHPLRKIVREGMSKAGLDLDVLDFEGVLQTHLHGDHSSGLEGLGYLHWFLKGSPAPIAATDAVIAPLWEQSLKASMGVLMKIPGYPDELGAEPVFTENSFEKFFQHVRLDDEGPTEVGPFTVEVRRTIHHIPTTAMRVSAGGRTLGLSADTAFDPELIAWLDEADLIIHETGHGVHTPLDRLTALPEETRAKMRLIHYPDDYDLDAANIESLVEGRRYPV
jgi:ribonuclease BN (tRNA processing enzyme)